MVSYVRATQSQASNVATRMGSAWLLLFVEYDPQSWPWLAPFCVAFSGAAANDALDIWFDFEDTIPSLD